MSMDQWNSAVYDYLKPYLKIKPTFFLKLMEKGMRWLLDWKVSNFRGNQKLELGKEEGF